MVCFKLWLIILSRALWWTVSFYFVRDAPLVTWRLQTIDGSCTATIVVLKKCEDVVSTGAKWLDCFGTTEVIDRSTRKTAGLYWLGTDSVYLWETGTSMGTVCTLESPFWGDNVIVYFPDSYSQEHSSWRWGIVSQGEHRLAGADRHQRDHYCILVLSVSSTKSH